MTQTTAKPAEAKTLNDPEDFIRRSIVIPPKHKLLIKPLWNRNYRVNVYKFEADEVKNASATIEASYFVQVIKDGSGNMQLVDLTKNGKVK